MSLGDPVINSGQRDALARQLSSGMELDGVLLRDADVDWMHHDTLRFVLQEGR